MEKLNVGVIFGGRSGEHEVSLMSARSVLGALDRERYEITEIGITHDGIWLVGENVLDAMSAGKTGLANATLLADPTRQGVYSLRDKRTAGEIALAIFAKLDVVFPVLHGSFGEDGAIQGLLEMAELAYVGAGVLGSSVGMDKGVFKDVMRANDIPVVESLIVLRSALMDDMEAVLERTLGVAEFPLFVKPANMGSSVGVTKCNSRSDLMEGLMEAARFDRRILIERGVNAREIEVSVLGNDQPIASVPGEVIPSHEFYSYEAKYIDDRSDLIIPAPLTEVQTDEVRRLAVKAYRAIDCAGMARVDFLIEKDETGSGLGIYLNELNTIPGFTQISMYPKLWAASGISYPELVDRLVQLALERKAERDRTERRFRRVA